MKVQKVKVRESQYMEYYMLYVNIPERIRESMGLSGGSIVHLGMESDSRLYLSRRKRRDTDSTLNLTEYVTRNYNGRQYTILRMTIPERLAKILGVDENSRAEFFHGQRGCHVDFL